VGQAHRRPACRESVGNPRLALLLSMAMGPRKVDVVSAVLFVVGMGGIALNIGESQEGGEFVGAILAVGVVASAWRADTA
jgi:hypothetical protein